MRNIAVKADNVGDTLSAGAFNTNLGSELETICTSADFTLDPEAGPDTNVQMLSQAAAAYANAGQQYADSGAANAYVLAIASNLKSVSKYYDGMKVIFKAGNANTGASTINVASLGVKNLQNQDGSALSSGQIPANGYVVAIYSLSNDRFEIAGVLAERIADIIFASGKGLDFTADTKGFFRGCEAIVWRMVNDEADGAQNPLGGGGSDWEIADDIDPGTTGTPVESPLGGSGVVTESNGVFTLASPGNWLVIFKGTGVSAGGAISSMRGNIFASNDGGTTYLSVVSSTSHMYGTVVGGQSCFGLLQSVDGTNTKVKVEQGTTPVSSAHFRGSGAGLSNKTCLVFIKLADKS